MSQEENLRSHNGELPDDQEDLRTITRADLTEAVHQRTGLGRTESAQYVEMVLGEIFDAIVAREEVKLSSFGVFSVRAKRERQGRNPKTGEEAKITARLVVTFKPSNILRERVNNGFSPEGSESPRFGDGESRVAPHEYQSEEDAL